VENVLDPLSVPLEEDEKLPDELVAELKKGRFFGLTIPQEYGGQGWSAVEWFPVLEELAKAYATVRLIAHTMNGLFWVCSGGRSSILEPKNKKRSIYRSWHPVRSGPLTA
jgi:acyl-CoA dehydrogenase